MEVEELSLLVWLSRGGKNKLIKLMCKYTECDPEVYTNTEIISLFENSLINISRKYHLKNLLFDYFYAKRNWKAYAFFHQPEYTEENVEIDSLGSAIFSIQPKVFDEEDLDTIKKLKEKYLEKDKSE